MSKKISTILALTFALVSSSNNGLLAAGRCGPKGTVCHDYCVKTYGEGTKMTTACSNAGCGDFERECQKGYDWPTAEGNCVDHCVQLWGPNKPVNEDNPAAVAACTAGCDYIPGNYTPTIW